jgi:very-short-patch-repair endonuclease
MAAAPRPRRFPRHPPLPAVADDVSAAERRKARPRGEEPEADEEAFGLRNARVAAIADAQRGLITTAQLLGAGFSSAAVSRAAGAMRLHRLHRGVYAVGHRRLAPWAREHAALLAAGEDWLLSHATGAALWGQIETAPALVDLVRRGGQRARRPGLALHRTARLDEEDRATRFGLPVTAPARTLIDLAGVMDERRFVWIVEQARVRRMVSPGALQAALGRAPAGRGAAVLRAHLSQSTAPRLTRSGGERRLLDLVRRAQLPEPQANARVAGWEVDLWWPGHRLAVELDGRDGHSSTTATERDHRKQAALAAKGIRLVRISGIRLHRAPYAVIAEIAAALNDETAGPGAPRPAVS